MTLFHVPPSLFGPDKYGIGSPDFSPSLSLKVGDSVLERLHKRLSEGPEVPRLHCSWIKLFGCFLSFGSAFLGLGTAKAVASF